MATFYVDPVGGNDASAGTSFATRWQSLTSGATAARVAPGDTVRVIASPDATSLGQSATWTDGSRTVTLTTAVNATILAATAAWTTVTNTSSTTSTDRKLGSTSSSLSVAAAFTTGNSHYAATGSALNLSGYQQITFWIKQTSGTLASADGELTIKLCSDTLGTTAVDTFNIPRIKALNQWQAFTIDKGSALGSSIQSVAFFVNSDRGAQTFLINNILAVKAASSADSLSLTSLISKNSGTEGWWAIDSISGTTVTLRTAGPNYNLSLSGTPSGYAGTTETVTTYKRQPIELPSSLVATATTSSLWGNVVDSGTSGSPITVSGGWNTTDMSTQTGDTYINGVNGLGYGLLVSVKNYVTIDKINPFGFYIGLTVNGAVNDISVTAKDISCNSAENVVFQNNSAATAGPLNCTLTADNVNCAGQVEGSNIYVNRSAKNCLFNVTNNLSCWNYGIRLVADGTAASPYNITRCKFIGTNVRRQGTYGIWGYNANECEFVFDTVTNAATSALFLNNYQGSTTMQGVTNCKFTLTSAAGSNGASVIQLYGASNNQFVLNGATVSGGTSGFSHLFGSGGNVIVGGTFSSNSGRDIGTDTGKLVLIGTTLNSTTKYTLYESGSSSIFFQKYQNTADDHRQYYDYGSILSDTTTRHTASGISWKISPTSTQYVTSTFPMVLPVGQVAVGASALVTAKVWVNRSNTGITTKFVCRGGQIAGVSADVVATASGSSSTWEELTITFTPSEAGVVELEVQAYGGTTYSVYVDDLTVTQA